LDTILQQPPTTALNLYQKLMPYAFHFFDKEGHPVYIQKTGSAHVDLIASFVTREQVLLTHGFDMETMCQKAREQTQKLNKQIESFVFVLDVQGISMKFMSFIKFLQAVTEMDQVFDHFFLPHSFYFYLENLIV
jgi:RNase adaptor protein for sRNA GlmZ degradation